MGLEKVFIKPGVVSVQEEESLLCAVLTFGVTVSLYDKILRKGGLNFYLYPNSKKPINKTPLFGIPSTNCLINSFLNFGSDKSNLEAHIFGGAYLREENSKMKMIANENVKLANKVLKDNGIFIKSQDVGGHMGRKLIFNTFTGESIVAKVNVLRQQDWSLEYSIQTDQKGFEISSEPV